VAEGRTDAPGMAPGALLSEIRQSFQLMGILAAVVGFYLGLGLLAVRVLA
jgi:hypothetical protein